MIPFFIPPTECLWVAYRMENCHINCRLRSKMMQLHKHPEKQCVTAMQRRLDCNVEVSGLTGPINHATSIIRASIFFKQGRSCSKHTSSIMIHAARTIGGSKQ